MPESIRFKGVYAIGDSDPNALPVDALEPALPFYAERLAFTVTPHPEADPPAATLSRDGVRLTLVQNGGDPEQSSCYFEVSDVTSLHRSLSADALDVTPLRDEVHDGVRHRLFFLRAPDRLCYCIGQEM